MTIWVLVNLFCHIAVLVHCKLILDSYIWHNHSGTISSEGPAEIICLVNYRFFLFCLFCVDFFFNLPVSFLVDLLTNMQLIWASC